MWAGKYIMQKFTEETKMDNEYFDIANNLMKFICLLKKILKH